MKAALIVAAPLLLLGAAGGVGYLAYRRSHPASKGVPKGIAVGEPSPSAVPQSLPDVMPKVVATWSNMPAVVSDLTRAVATGSGGLPPNISEIIYAADNKNYLYNRLWDAKNMKAIGQPAINGEPVETAILRLSAEFSTAQDKYQALFAAANAAGYDFSFT